MSGSGKELEQSKRVRLPTPAQLIRSDLECGTRTNLPINHCAEMSTRILRSEDGLSAQPQPVPLKYKGIEFYLHQSETNYVRLFPTSKGSPNLWSKSDSDFH